MYLADSQYGYTFIQMGGIQMYTCSERKRQISCHITEVWTQRCGPTPLYQITSAHFVPLMRQHSDNHDDGERESLLEKLVKYDDSAYPGIVTDIDHDVSNQRCGRNIFYSYDCLIST